MKLVELKDVVFKFKTEAAIFAVGITVGMTLGWKLWRPVKPKPETYAASTTQKDGSVVLERKPDPKAKPAQEVPKGAVVERVVQITVQPLPPLPPTPAGTPAIQVPDSPRTQCPPVTVDLTLVRMPDQTRRVIASAKDGRVVGGVDIPVEAAKPVKDLKWAAGVAWNPADKTYGAFVDRDAAFLRLGAELIQVREPVTAGGRVTWSGLVKVGIRF